MKKLFILRHFPKLKVRRPLLINKSGAGFTLIEIIVAIFVITVGAGGAFNLIQKTISFTSISSSQLTAAYLTQEGIETVRNTRDSNWLARADWDQGLSSTDWQDVVMNGETSIFDRKITITVQGAGLLVLVEVKWQERGRDHEVAAQTKLYDWK